MNAKSHEAIVCDRLMESAENRKRFGASTITLYHEGEALKAYGQQAMDLANAIGAHTTMDGGIHYLEFEYYKRDMHYPRLVKKGYKVCIIDI